MSIQSSINQALAATEQALLGTGMLPTPKRKYPGDTEGGPEAPESPTVKREPRADEQGAEGENVENAAPGAATSPVSQILTGGNDTAAAIARGRVQATQEQKRKRLENARGRLAELQRKGKSPGSKEARKIKKEIKQIRKGGID